MAREAKETFMDKEVFVPINLGPMIDCVMLLLMYYINCSSLETNRVSKDVVLPFAQQGLKEENTTGRFIVSIEWNESLYEATYVANGIKMTDPRDMTALIVQSMKLQGKPQNFRVIIRADKEATHGKLTELMGRAKEAGARTLTIATEQTKKK